VAKFGPEAYRLLEWLVDEQLFHNAGKKKVPLPRVVVADCYPDGMYRLYSEEDVAKQKRQRAMAEGTDGEEKKRTRRSDTPELIRGIIAAHASLVISVGDIDDLLYQMKAEGKSDKELVATIKACIQAIKQGQEEARTFRLALKDMRSRVYMLGFRESVEELEQRLANAMDDMVEALP
jgi:DNA-binding transcriptional MerR regulator